MSKLVKQADGFYSENLEPGTVVFDKAKDGDNVGAISFQVGSKDYETDENGAIVATEPEATNSAPTADADGFLNPFAPGVSYKAFLESIPDGVEVADYLEGRDFEQHQIDWLIGDLKHYEANKTN